MEYLTTTPAGVVSRLSATFTTRALARSMAQAVNCRVMTREISFTPKARTPVLADDETIAHRDDRAPRDADQG
jgi:hypothetical protein